MPDLGTTLNRLRDHLLEFSVRRGDFVLKSGRRSDWFIDGKQTACRAEGILLIADALLERLDPTVTAVGGLTMGADPVAYGVVGVAAARGRELRAFSVRKEAKGHGVAGRVAGALLPGDRVAVVEDVVTRGLSPLEAVEVVREFGADPVVIIPVVDRGGTCAEMAARAGVAFEPLLTAPDLGLGYQGA